MNLLISYALQFVGIHYKYGGEHPLTGYDCSGFVQELLRSAGEDPKGDQTAQGLFDWFSTNGNWNIQMAGALAFYGPKVTSVQHVAMMLDKYRVIEAGGGWSETQTKDDAIKHGAMIRIRRLNARGDLCAIIRPHYKEIGQL